MEEGPAQDHMILRVGSAAATGEVEWQCLNLMNSPEREASVAGRN